MSKISHINQSLYRVYDIHIIFLGLFYSCFLSLFFLIFFAAVKICGVHWFWRSIFRFSTSTSYPHQYFEQQMSFCSVIRIRLAYSYKFPYTTILSYLFYSHFSHSFHFLSTFKNCGKLISKPYKDLISHLVIVENFFSRVFYINKRADNL